MVSPSPLRPVIVITGANSGVGFGLAQRLLVQLSSPTPPDTLATHPHLTPPEEQPLASPFAAPNGCILILACRNAIKAHRARAQLQALLQYLEDLPDEAETPLSVPASVLDVALESKVNGSIDEDADPALVAQAVEASLRRRRRRNKAVSLSSSEETDEGRDLTRDPKTGRTFSLFERQIKARGRYRRKFCAETKIEFQALDLGSMASALICAKEITAR
jgi:3-keto steroid reductase